MDGGNGDGSIHGESVGIGWEEEDVLATYQVYASPTCGRSESTLNNLDITYLGTRDGYQNCG